MNDPKLVDAAIWIATEALSVAYHVDDPDLERALALMREFHARIERVKPDDDDREAVAAVLRGVVRAAEPMWDDAGDADRMVALHAAARALAP